MRQESRKTMIDTTVLEEKIEWLKNEVSKGEQIHETIVFPKMVMELEKSKEVLAWAQAENKKVEKC